MLGEGGGGIFTARLEYLRPLGAVIAMCDLPGRYTAKQELMKAGKQDIRGHGCGIFPPALTHIFGNDIKLDKH